MKLRSGISIFALAVVATTASADVVPNIYGAAAAPATFLAFGSTRTYQFVIDSGQMTGLVGMNIVGMSFRLNETATVAGPTAPMTSTDFEVWIGSGVDPSAMSTTTASNFTSAPTQVRDGAAAIPAGVYGTGNPAPFGPIIALDPWLYSGGDVAIMMTFQGWVGATLTFDAANATAPGYGIDYASRWVGGFNAATLTNGANFIVTDILGRPVPEPGSVIGIGVGIALFAFRKRLRH